MKIKKVEKPWGHELIWANTKKYAGKILYIKKGNQLSRQFHKKKEETIFVQTGILALEIGAKEYKTTLNLNSGQSYHIAPNTVHRFCAPHGDVILFEVSTPELDDVVRLEDDYGR
tara:strand:- start:9 stop:353 length:345 start_codon:yes stop_codon:yes gene_type:complete